MPSTSPATVTPSSSCQFCASCTDCGCGPGCQCTETLCQCQASSLLNSINFSLFKAEWTIDMHCQVCARMTQNVLGPQAAVNLATKSASLIVDSEEEAKDFTEALLDVGLDATLVKVVRLDGGSPKMCAKKAKKADTVTPLTFSHNDPEDPDSLLQSTLEPRYDPLAPLPSTPSQSATTTTTIELAIGGMTCSMCSKAITQTLNQLPGVQKVNVSLPTNMATIVLTEGSPTTPAQLQEAVESVGYTVQQILTTQASSKIQQMQESQQADVVRKKHSFLLSLVGTLPISIMTMVLPHFPSIPWMHATITIRGHVFLQESLVLAALGTLVQFGSGWTFYKTSHSNIVLGQLGMDVLVAVGTTASYIYAWIQTWKGQEAHAFETSAVLISFVLLGKWMNSLAVRRTSQALTQLMKLQSKTAIQVMPDGSEHTVDVERIHPGDTVKILRGASLPADGIVSIGEMMVDESMMTGESMPILKTPGSLVLGGTVCMESDGALVCVTGVGANTALAQIVQLVQDAQTRQVPIQNLADSISAVFVPAVCTLAVLTFLVWYILCKTGVVPHDWYRDEGDVTFSLMFAIACLVISCPCALGLATPTAVMVGTGVAAKFGVLMKGGETLEMASKVNAVVFDKTGTLTVNRPTISDFFMLPSHSMDRDDLLWLFASLERNSEHPLATAVVTYALEQLDDEFLAEKPLKSPIDFVAKTGRGAMGIIDDHPVVIGNRPFVKDLAVISPEIESIMSQLEEEGKTAILACVHNEVQVVMGIADELKADAAATLRYLQDRMDIDVWMVTGDNARTAAAIARQLGLSQDRVISEALPVAKVRQVKRLQRDGKMVCMVGDGINDSAAMAQANVGISLATGAEIAIEAADMVLVREGHVQEVVTALDLSRVLFRRIQLNFVFSLIYNCLGIPVAAGVFYPLVQVRLPPTLAAVAMALSSLSVVSSSLALRLYRPPKVEDEPSNIQQFFHRWSSTTMAASNRRAPVLEDDMQEPLLPNSQDHLGD